MAKSSMHVTYNRKGERVSEFTSVTSNGTTTSVTRQFSTRADIRKDRLDNFNIVGGWLKVFIAILLLSILYNAFFGTQKIPSFSELLNFLGTAPNFSAKSVFVNGIIPLMREPTVLDFGLFDITLYVFPKIINAFVKVLNTLVFIVVAVANVITYVIWFFGWLFGV